MMPHELKDTPMPPRIARLPRSANGYPVPWFVAWYDGVPDFRVIDREKYRPALRESRCWLCGDRLGAYKTFPIGPMCAVNRISSEPPSHLDCATYAARVCPFLARPHAKRRETGLPDHDEAAGHGLTRNPGVILLWTTRAFERFRVDADPAAGSNPGVLFRVGDPTSLQFFAEGRPATRAEIDISITSGLPHLEAIAVKQGSPAVLALRDAVEAAHRLINTVAPRVTPEAVGTATC
jgi:hypothetical protein